MTLPALLAMTLIWPYVSSSKLIIKKISISVVALVILTGFILAVNYKPLTADIAWRGDESFHIFTLMHLVRYIQSSPTTFFFYKYLPFDWSTDSLNLHNMIRWPFIEKWINFLFLFPQFSYDIRLYRIIPLISTILLGWYLFYQWNKKIHSAILSLLFAFTLITIPLIYFYTTIVYLEMPIVLLGTYCVFNLQDILFSDMQTLTKKPVWYALLILGFLKETVIIILVVLIGLRFVLQIRSKKITIMRIVSEIWMYVLVLLPLAIFLFFRNSFIYERPHYFQWSVLLEITTYRIAIEALVRQFGALFFLSIGGFLVLLLQKEKWNVWAQISLCTGIFIFFITDSQLYIGYSRWNLFLVPVFLYLAYRFITYMNNTLRVIVLILLIVSNYALNPIMPDGVRISNWGCPNTDGAEYYYPYEEAIQYLQQNHHIQTVLLLGQYFPHWGIQFYQAKYDFYPQFIINQFNGNQPPGVVWFDGRRFDTRAEKNYLSEYFAHCINNVDAIVYHSVNNVDIPTNTSYCGKFKTIVRFRNSQNSLYVFE